MKKTHIRPWPRNDERKNREELLKEKRRSRLDTMMVIATIMSSIATTVAVVIAIYQYGVARDQLVAADRNRSIQTMTEQVRVTCQMLGEIGVKPDTIHRPGLMLPLKPTEPKDVEKYGRLLLEDLSTAEEEGRLFYDLDKVKNREIDEAFVTAYSQHYSDLMSSAQTVRLWIGDADIDALQRIKNLAFFVLDPRLVLPDSLLKQNSQDRSYDKFQSVAFDTYQMASLYCGVLEPLIIDWAKGKDVSLPKFTPIPTVTRQTAEQQVREDGRIKRITTADIDPLSP